MTEAPLITRIPFLSRWLSLILLLFCVSCAATRSDYGHSIRKEPLLSVRVTSGRGRTLKLPMETYLTGVIGHEMSPRWPDEALKAQAVAARSYALYRMIEARKTGRRFDVVDTQGDQVFRESGIHNARLRELVEKTRGEVLWDSRKGRIVQAFYSSTCGGQSETAKGAGLSDDSPLQICFKDKFCSISPFHDWSYTLGKKELEQRLNRGGYPARNLRDLKIKKKNPSGYVKTLEYRDDRGRHDISAVAFRKLANNMRLKSLLFTLDSSGDSYTFNGRGFGHGVGLCQYGARGMAEHDKPYRKILQQYYPKMKIRKLY